MTNQSTGANPAQHQPIAFNLSDAEKAALDAQALTLGLSPEDHAAELIKRALDNHARRTKPGEPLRADFTHRLGTPGYTAAENIADIITLMAERASGILEVVLCLFEEAADTIAPGSVCRALYAALAELEDIEQAALAFGHAERGNQATNPAPLAGNSSGKHRTNYGDLPHLKQVMAQFSAIMNRVETALTAYHRGESVSLELALSDVSRLACDGHAAALELRSRLNNGGAQ